MKHFHGNRKKHSFFEGWYLKHQKQNTSVALIPAYHIDKQGCRQASIQIITNTTAECVFFDPEEFSADEQMFLVTVGKNIFSMSGITLNFQTEHLHVSGQLTYEEITAPHSPLMGPFRHIPFMECNHDVLSLCHSLHGILEINGEIIDLNDGIGYIEKDWGSSFPQSYLWTQCLWANPYNQQSSSIMVSVANIPFGPFSFTGCICSVYFGKAEYRLATYKKVKILEYTEQNIILEQGKYLLHVHRLSDHGKPLKAPRSGDMGRIIHESLSCQVRYQFFINRRKIFDILSSEASFEYDIMEDSINSSRL